MKCPCKWQDTQNDRVDPHAPVSGDTTNRTKVVLF